MNTNPLMVTTTGEGGRRSGGCEGIHRLEKRRLKEENVICTTLCLPPNDCGWFLATSRALLTYLQMFRAFHQLNKLSFVLWLPFLSPSQLIFISFQNSNYFHIFQKKRNLIDLFTTGQSTVATLAHTQRNFSDLKQSRDCDVQNQIVHNFSCPRSTIIPFSFLLRNFVCVDRIILH